MVGWGQFRTPGLFFTPDVRIHPGRDGKKRKWKPPPADTPAIRWVDVDSSRQQVAVGKAGHAKKGGGEQHKMFRCDMWLSILPLESKTPLPPATRLFVVLVHAYHLFRLFLYGIRFL